MKTVNRFGLALDDGHREITDKPVLLGIAINGYQRKAESRPIVPKVPCPGVGPEVNPGSEAAICDMKRDIIRWCGTGFEVKS